MGMGYVNGGSNGYPHLAISHQNRHRNGRERSSQKPDSRDHTIRLEQKVTIADREAIPTLQPEWRRLIGDCERACQKRSLRDGAHSTSLEVLRNRPELIGLSSDPFAVFVEPTFNGGEGPEPDLVFVYLERGEVFVVEYKCGYREGEFRKQLTRAIDHFQAGYGITPRGIYCYPIVDGEVFEWGTLARDNGSVLLVPHRR